MYFLRNFIEAVWKKKNTTQFIIEKKKGSMTTRDALRERLCDECQLYTIYPDPVYKAAFYCHFDCVKILVDLGFKWHELVCENAALKGDLDMLVYAHEHGCPWGVGTIHESVHYDNGPIDCLKYAYENGCPVERDYIMEHAVLTENIAAMDYLISKGHEMTEDLVNVSIEYNKPVSLKYLLDRLSARLDDRTMDDCVFDCIKEDNRVCLGILLDYGAKLEPYYISYAAGYDSIECLKLLRERGCEWDTDTLERAWKGEAVQCLEYCLNNGCPLGDAKKEIVLSRIESLKQSPPPPFCTHCGSRYCEINS